MPEMPVRVSFIEMSEIGFHANGEDLRVLIVLDGSLRVLVDEKETFLSKGGFLVIDPGRVHSLKSLAGPADLGIIDINVAAFLTELPYLASASIECVCPGSDLPAPPEVLHVRNLLIRILLMSRIQRSKTQDIIRRLTTRMLFLFHAKFLNSQYLVAPISEMSVSNREHFYSMSSFISQHYKDKLSLAQIAANEGLSISRISHIWRNITGISLHQAITLFRLFEVSKELATSNLAISEIAIECGFSDVKYLFNIFSKVYGMSPSQYRSVAIASRRRENSRPLKTVEIKPLVSDFLVTFYRGDLPPDMEYLTPKEREHENLMDRLHKNIFCNSEIMTEHFSQKDQTTGYLLLSNNSTLQRGEKGFQVYWEYVYPVMYLYGAFRTKIRVELDLDSFPASAWAKPVDEFIAEAELILGKNLAKVLSLSLNTGKVENREKVMALNRHILARYPQIKTLIRIIL